MTEPSKSPRGFEVALSYLDAEILSGRLTQGTRLPAERDLATQLGVSRGAVREAIRVLQTQGILVSATGPGNGTRVEVSPVGAIAQFLQLHVALKTHSFAELTATRSALEAAAMAAAAQRRDPESIARARDLLAQMTDASAIENFHDLDTAFHVELISASGNQLLSDLCVAIRVAVQEPIARCAHEHHEWESLRARLIDEHTRLLEHIGAGDAEAAGRLAHDHIEWAFASLVDA